MSGIKYFLITVQFHLYAGDADGKGNTRKDELYKASATLKVM